MQNIVSVYICPFFFLETVLQSFNYVHECPYSDSEELMSTAPSFHLAPQLSYY